MEIYRNHTRDWHTRDDWPVEVMDLVGGHGTKHVYDGPKKTADRILNPQPGDRIPTASTHTFSPDDADYLVKETLRQNSNEIDFWFKTSMTNERLRLVYMTGHNQPTGYGILRNGTTFQPTYKMRVDLIRTKKGYVIDRYYPSFE